jgi:hypothetical protein
VDEKGRFGCGKKICLWLSFASGIISTNISMRRIHLFEFHEQPWFPSSIRDEITDMLQFGLNLTNAYGPAVPLLKRALLSTGSSFVVDLCSGGGGPWLALSRKLRGSAPALQICLTDKYPNLTSFKNAKAISDDFTFYRGPVDATNVPSELKGFRTMFTSFHHFPRAEALAILQGTVDARQSIGITAVRGNFRSEGASIVDSD